MQERELAVSCIHTHSVEAGSRQAGMDFRVATLVSVCNIISCDIVDCNQTLCQTTIMCGLDMILPKLPNRSSGEMDPI